MALKIPPDNPHRASAERMSKVMRRLLAKLQEKRDAQKARQQAKTPAEHTARASREDGHAFALTSQTPEELLKAEAENRWRWEERRKEQERA